MFTFLWSKHLRGVSVLIVAFGIFLYYIDTLVEKFVSKLLGYQFFYTTQPFLKLIFLLMGVVVIALVFNLNKNDRITPEEIKKRASHLVLSMIISFLIGLAIHIYFVYSEMTDFGSLSKLENNLLIYFLPNFMLVLGFLFGAWPIRKLNADRNEV